MSKNFLIRVFGGSGVGLILHLIIFLKRTLATFIKSVKNRLIYSQLAIIQNLKKRAMSIFTYGTGMKQEG